MIHRVRPPKGTVVALRSELLSQEEQRLIARKRARLDIPTVQRDFRELWGRERQPKRKGNRVA